MSDPKEFQLNKLLENVHNEIANTLKMARECLAHPTTKGDATEDIWLEILRRYLPLRYQVEKGFVIDSSGKISDQIDIIIFDRQYTPMVFELKGAKLIPAESVYAVFEVKQTISKEYLDYAYEKIKSVTDLYRTSGYIMNTSVENIKRDDNGGDEQDTKFLPNHKTEPKHILGGILTLTSTWRNTDAPIIGHILKDKLNELENKEKDKARLDIGCIAECGYFYYQTNTDVILERLDLKEVGHKNMKTFLEERGTDSTQWGVDELTKNSVKVGYHIYESECAIPIFIFQLIERLSRMGTAPKIMNLEYIKSLEEQSKEI